MNSHFRIRNHVLMMALTSAYPILGHAASAARIEFVAGNVVAVTAAGVQRELSRGAELQSGEAIRTGDNSRAQLRFSDGGMMSLQPQTEFRIDDYRYNGKADGSERGFFSLIKGGLRTISGIIGHGNRSSYKVSTSVATIGIRGTEYSAVFTGGTDGVLNLATGEGAVEVCNAGGCVIIASGESAVVTGTTPPKFTPLRPNLPAPATTGGNTTTAAEPYSASETRTAGGTLALFGPELTTGSDYVYAAVFYDTSSSTTRTDQSSSATATFDLGSKLVGLSGGTYSFSSPTVKSAFSVDGVIGWGVWSTGDAYDGYSSTVPLKDLHYVVGKPTSDAELQNLSGMTGTYQLIGYTTPTSTQGYTGSSVTGSLTANFGASTTVDANIGFTMNGQSVTANVSGMYVSSGTFSGTGSTNLASGSASFQGLLAGTNASHAGLTYQISGGSSGLGNISGAQVFKQTSLTTSSQQFEQ